MIIALINRHININKFIQASHQNWCEACRNVEPESRYKG